MYSSRQSRSLAGITYCSLLFLLLASCGKRPPAFPAQEFRRTLQNGHESVILIPSSEKPEVRTFSLTINQKPIHVPKGVLGLSSPLCGPVEGRIEQKGRDLVVRLTGKIEGKDAIVSFDLRDDFLAGREVMIIDAELAPPVYTRFTPPERAAQTAPLATP